MVAKLLAVGARLGIDPLPLLGERAAHLRLEPQGTTSCGGGTRLLQAADAWIAVSLPRPEDLELVPAWLEADDVPPDAWPLIAATVAARPAAEVIDRAILLGLPVALLPSGPPAVTVDDPVARLPVRGAAAPKPLSDVLVVDLSSLWAGPLCGSLLADAGASVVKVESTARPDGARLGPSAFFDLLNGAKRSVALDFRSTEGVAELRRLVARADVVIEASRPRALEQLGLEARALVADGPQVWVSITGHGRGAGRDRVAFGDDAAVAGGLVCWDGGTPVFCADAVADPTTGLLAAAAVLDALAEGGRWLLDVSMAEVARHLAGPTVPHSLPADAIAPPRTRVAVRPAPAFGADNAAVLAGR
jgi:hypothetical protein